MIRWTFTNDEFGFDGSEISQEKAIVLLEAAGLTKAITIAEAQIAAHRSGTIKLTGIGFLHYMPRE